MEENEKGRRERIKLTDNSDLKSVVEKATQVLENGGVILYPTDTLYGLGVDSLNKSALKKLRLIKGRSSDKAFSHIVADLEMAKRYGEINEVAEKLANTFLPGPLTLILKNREETFGIRIPNNMFCISLSKKLDGPCTATSANVSGLSSEVSIDKILEQLGEKSKLIDLIIDAGELSVQKPSTVVDVSRGEIDILREGAISKEEIDEILNR
jgi:L-threonylcarbamoyladenylate synthase